MTSLMLDRPSPLAEITNDLTRREFLGGVTGLLVGAACGTDGQPVASPTPTAEGTRTVAHRYGENHIPAHPERVVVLNTSTILATTLEVGVPVVATVFPPSGEGLVSYLAEDTVGLENVGWIGGLDLEKIATLNPDLIIGNTAFITEDIHPLLEQIAPTVAFETFGSNPWKEAVRQVAAVYDREQAVDDDIDAFEARIEKFKAAMGDRLQGLEATIAQIRATDDIRIYTKEWCAGQVLQEAGIGRPENQQKAEEFSYIKLSIERIPQLDADAIFYFVGASAVKQEKAESAAQAVTSNPLWQQLEAVRAGLAYRVDASHWFTCGPIEPQNLILDDLEKHLLGAAS